MISKDLHIYNSLSNSKEKFKSKEIVKVLVGKSNALISSHRTDEKPFFGIGNEKEKGYWMALIRQSLVAGFLKKEIEFKICHLYTPFLLGDF